jgi:hypothetical protein
MNQSARAILRYPKGKAMEKSPWAISPAFLFQTAKPFKIKKPGSYLLSHFAAVSSA